MINFFKKIFKSGVLVLIVLFSFSLTTVLAVNTLLDGYKLIPSASPQPITGADGTCSSIANTSINSYFIPTRTAGEWSAFKAAIPRLAGLSQTSCITPIYTCADLSNIRNNTTGSYYLANNIDCSGFSFIPIGSFFGTLDGRGFTVSNISITGSGFPGVGLFYQTKNATIKNIGLVNANIGNTSQSYVGGLVGYDWGGTNISNSFVSGTVTGYQYVGGLVGWMEYYMTGPTIYTSSINSSFSTADVSGADAVGGLIGYVIGGSTISNSYATGSVVINPSVSSYPVSGGLIGYMNGAIITNSYSIGSVSSFSIGAGGLIGASSFGTVNSSYWDTENSGKTTSAGGTGLTMAQIKTQSSFTGWDFSTIWNIVSGSSPLSNGSSPFLRTTPALSGVWQNTLKACSDIPSCRNYFAPGGFPLLPACFPSVAGVPGGGVMGCENALVPRYIYKYQ